MCWKYLKVPSIRIVFCLLTNLGLCYFLKYSLHLGNRHEMGDLNAENIKILLYYGVLMCTIWVNLI